MRIHFVEPTGVQSVELHFSTNFKSISDRLRRRGLVNSLLFHFHCRRNHLLGNPIPLVLSHLGTNIRVDLYKIRRNGTLPQGLLMGTIFLMLAVLALNYSLTMIVAPQYAHYGNQRYCNHTIGDFGEVRDCSKFPELILPCAASAEAEEVCTPAVISTFINRITLAFPFFGEVAFWGQFAFLGVWMVAAVICGITQPKVDHGGEHDDDDDETTGLLDGR